MCNTSLDYVLGQESGLGTIYTENETSSCERISQLGKATRIGGSRPCAPEHLDLMTEPTSPRCTMETASGVAWRVAGPANLGRTPKVVLARCGDAVAREGDNEVSSEDPFS